MPLAPVECSRICTRSLRRAASSIVSPKATWCVSRSLTAEAGASVEFDKVLVVGQGADIRIGKPYVAGTKVTATVQKHGQSDKVPIVKFRRRKHYMRQGTHRQQYTEVKITGISG